MHALPHTHSFQQRAGHEPPWNEFDIQMNSTTIRVGDCLAPIDSVTVGCRIGRGRVAIIGVVDIFNSQSVEAIIEMTLPILLLLQIWVVGGLKTHSGPLPAGYALARRTCYMER